MNLSSLSDLCSFRVYNHTCVDTVRPQRWFFHFRPWCWLMHGDFTRANLWDIPLCTLNHLTSITFCDWTTVAFSSAENRKVQPDELFGSPLRKSRLGFDGRRRKDAAAPASSFWSSAEDATEKMVATEDATEKTPEYISGFRLENKHLSDFLMRMAISHDAASTTNQAQIDSKEDLCLGLFDFDYLFIYLFIHSCL